MHIYRPCVLRRFPLISVPLEQPLTISRLEGVLEIFIYLGLSSFLLMKISKWKDKLDDEETTKKFHGRMDSQILEFNKEMEESRNAACESITREQLKQKRILMRGP